MQTLTLDQLRVATEAGGVSGVTLQAEGGKFFVRIKTANNADAVLARARSDEPRGFPKSTACHRIAAQAGNFRWQF